MFSYLETLLAECEEMMCAALNKQLSRLEKGRHRLEEVECVKPMTGKAIT